MTEAASVTIEPAIGEAAQEKFVSSVPFSASRGETIVVMCVDGRFRAQTEEFLEKGLGLVRPTIFSIPGGPAPFIPLVGIAHKLIKGWMDELLRKFPTRRIVCIAHEDCAAYQRPEGKILNFLVQSTAGKTVRELQLNHLARARATFRTWFPSIPVEFYYADPRENADGGMSVAFTKVE